MNTPHCQVLISEPGGDNGTTVQPTGLFSSSTLNAITSTALVCSQMKELWLRVEK